MYENNKLLCSALFLFCILASLFSQKIPEQVQAKSISVETKAKTWKVEEWLSEPRSETWTSTVSNKEEWRKECNSVCKIDELKRIGIIPEIAESLVTHCKNLADDPVNCIKVWAFIVKVESSWGNRCKTSNKYNCFWLSVKENYKSYSDWTLHFVWKYNRFWKNQKTPNSFYSNSPNWKPVTNFCLTEVSSWLPYCKNWHRTAWSVFNYLNNLF